MLGWVGFFLSLIGLPVFSLLLISYFLTNLSPEAFVLPSLSLAGGAFFSRFVFSARSQVLFHEYRHMVLSGLFGNKARKIKVGHSEGAFEYEYTADTKHANILISLAPYFLPFWTVAALLIIILTPHHEYSLLILSFGMGIDIEQWWEGFHPAQTDFHDVPLGILGGGIFCIFWQISFVLVCFMLHAEGWKSILGWFRHAVFLIQKFYS